MPGFFVDGQDYGGLTYQPVFPQPVVADSLFIGWNGQHDNRQNTLINDLTPPGGFGGSYDFWSNKYMFADDPCCCPELNCCFPKTVTATVNGFPNATRIPSRSMLNTDTWWTGVVSVIDDQIRQYSISLCAGAIETNATAHDNDAVVGGDLCCPSGNYMDYLCNNNETYPQFNCGPKPDFMIIFSGYHPIIYNSVEGLSPACLFVGPNTAIDYGIYNGIKHIAWPKAMFPPTNCGKFYCCGSNLVYPDPNSDGFLIAENGVAYGEYVAETGLSHIPKYFDETKIAPPSFEHFYTWSEICNDPVLGILCSQPTVGNITFGNNSAGTPVQGSANSKGLQTYDGDHNGTYICHKTIGFFRPELKPYFFRNNKPTVINDEDKAELLFEVEGRRQLSVTVGCTLGANGDSAIKGFLYKKLYPQPLEEDYDDVDGVPAGFIFCVDYPCGSRRFNSERGVIPGEFNELIQDCGWLSCDGIYGFAKPLLTTYELDDFVNGSGAVIKFDTIPMQFEWDGNIYDTDDSYAVSWGVDNFVIEKSGKDYEIGDTFVIDFDNTYERLLILPSGSSYQEGENIHLWRGGQHYPFPRTLKTLNAIEQYCTGDITYDLYEKYNRIKIEDAQQNDPLFQRFPFEEDPVRSGSYSDAHMIQTVRVTEVDQNGGIIKVEKVPWFKENELRPPEGTEIECPNVDEPTPFFPEYSRGLCHPQPVAKPGKGYAVGDKIVWVPDITQAQNIKVWKDQYAVGWVVDVDENGGILDWYISGGMFNLNETSDPRAYYGLGGPIWQQGYYYNKSDYYPSPCYGSLDKNFETGTYGDPYDYRGYYYYNGTPLCSLTWRGEGVPLRRRGAKISYDTTLADNVLPGCTSEQIVDTNEGTLTSVEISIQRVDSETTAGINVELYKYLYTSYLILINGNLNHPDVVNIGSQLADLVINFAPIPKCNGGGAKLKTIIYDCDDPTNPNCGNESVFGGSLSGVQILSSGAYYSFVDRIHKEPILPEFLPKPGSGESAVLSYTFDKVSNFPHPDVLNNTFYLKYFGYDYRVDPDRFAYFPIQDITIESPGSGYSIGDEFEIFPDGGGRFAGAWKGDSADNPITYPNGGWYDSNLTNVDPDTGYYDLYNLYPYDTLEPKAKIRITNIDNNGGITNIEILHSGMMFRSVETTGIAHPDVKPYINSTLGYGAKSNMVIDSDKDSESFGKLINFYFSNPDFQLVDDGYGNLIPSGIYDPLHSDVYSLNPTYVAWSGSDTKGYGRDYANPEHGYFWMLNNIYIVDSAANEEIYLTAYYPFGDDFYGNFQRINPHSQDLLYNLIHPDKSTHELVEGSMPNYVPKSNICCFEDCYYPLLNRTYDLVRVWNNNDQAGISSDGFHKYPYGRDGDLSGRPSNPFGVLQKKGTSIYPDDVLPIAEHADYKVVEHGFSITLNADIPASKDCPNHTDGRTFDAVDIGLNYGVQS